MNDNKVYKLSIVIPCYNEEKTLSLCVESVLAIAHERLTLEIIIVNDGSTDNSPVIAAQLAQRHEEIVALNLDTNQGKGAALRAGFQKATGDFVAVQDADLEYNPRDLLKLLKPLISGEADVVLGSRFLSSDIHRVLYFWHYLGNKLLTFLSNMFTDLNLSDMETCYKVFRREVIQNIEIHENRFGFEPEIVAKIAQLGLRIYEIGISYYGRTYEEGKKIGFKDGLRALYCIVRYNAPKAPIPLQFLIYIVIGGIAAVINYFIFLQLYHAGVSIRFAAPIAFFVAAAANYFLSITILFRHKARWNTVGELLVYLGVVVTVGALDLGITAGLYNMGATAEAAKITATIIGLVFNFAGRRLLVFSEPGSKPWKPTR